MRLPEPSPFRLIILMVMATAISAPSAMAAAPAPRWTASIYATPTNFVPNTNGKSVYQISAHNIGGTATDGVSPIMITDTLPEHLVATEASGQAAFGLHQSFSSSCIISGSIVTCTWDQATLGAVPSGGSLVMTVKVSVDTEASGSLADTAVVEGGGVDSASTNIVSPVGLTEAPFGFDTFTFGATDAKGLTYAQAGGHPYALTTDLDTSTILSKHLGFPPHYEGPEGGERDFVTDLPLGLLGDPRAVTQCPESAITKSPVTCPSSSQIGVFLPRTEGKTSFFTGGGGSEVPVYNVTPSHGFPAELGFNFDAQPVILFVSVRPGDYGLRVTVPGIERTVPLTGAELTIWGTPADPSHDHQRAISGSCATQCTYGATAGITSQPYLTNSSDCADPQQSATLIGDSWLKPASVPSNPDGTPNFGAANFTEPQWKTASAPQPAVTECNALTFNPTLALQPDTAHTDSPTGLDVDLNVPQPPDRNTLATPELKNATVTLPEGLVVNPSSAGGLQGCTPEQAGAGSTKPAACPDSSQVGTVTVETPLLEKSLPGQVYLGTPECDPCTEADAKEGRLLKLYIQINDPERGVVVKLPGTVTLDPATGRLAATFDQNPQLPFSDLKVHFKSGQRAPLTTPAGCGSYQTGSDLTPWSTPETPDAKTLSSFQISEGCGPSGFSPAFSAGTTNNQAAGFSPFSVTFSRQDGEQTLGSVNVTTPPGLLGVLKSVVQCPEPQASQGTCGPESLIGETTATAGSGSSPFLVKGGRVYLTGPYNGGPFGLSIVVPAVAGPFNLGNVIVRASIRVDSHTAQIIVVSDSLPTIKDGIPLQIRTVNVTIDRAGFMFNPTNCSPLSVTATITSSQDTSAGVSSPFEAANCASLPFKPSFKVSTQGSTSKANGASLVVKVGSSMGQANIGKVRVTLPKQLPARLTTLQKACTDTQFNANPAGCPMASNVGTATALTPLLAHPLTGPAYLVSHGGAAFPDLVFILQGEGILLYLDGNTDIKKGITTSTFNSVPDAPVTAFEAVLPEGPHSILATNIPAKAKNSLCGQKLTMPTTITGQNGGVVTQSTRIAVTGCPKVRQLSNAQKLTKALSVCHKKPKGAKRSSCEKQARKRYRPVKKK